MYTLGYAFKPWTEARRSPTGRASSTTCAQTAAENGIDKHIRFHHSVKRASWSSPDARWTVEAERKSGEGGTETVRFTCNFLFMCSGYYKYEEGYTPEFAGSRDFAGRIVHPQKWPEDLDYAGKRVVVIGSGATAVTLVPEMAKTAGHVTMLQRSPTYVVSRPAEDAIANWLRRNLPAKLAYQMIRWRNVLFGMYFFQLCRRKPERVKQADPRRRQEGARPGLRHRDALHAALQSLGAAAVPGAGRRPVHGDPGQARSVVTDQIDTFTESGIRLKSGSELEADIIVTATGLNLQVLGGLEVSVDGREGRFRANADLQGHDVLGRAEHGVGVRLHQRLVDAEMRSDLRICLPPDQPHGPARLHSACRTTSIPRHRSRGWISPPATCSARSRRCRSRARSGRGGSTRTTPSTSSRCATARSTTG